mgnify:CR=1 FL=1
MTDTPTTLTSVPDDYQVPPAPEQQQVPITIYTKDTGRFLVTEPDSWTWADQGVLFATGRWDETASPVMDVMIPLTTVRWIECHFENETTAAHDV